ncbi:glycosyltransferase [Roseococcus pinisoli]|uniref:Glycosyltransferase subfamily 4-like N-terminal domain-containing protein n=1 Tax=Roseococcus pinisoli TaxID=2835040 RepID=A0ABS5QCF3_9PROT|nr:glycosyltransferase [Roseococcus pinisoli]MBS7811345.1 hypothetical protein [Roseococcus pinisoli]
MLHNSNAERRSAGNPPLTVLLTNVWLDGPGGTECVVREVAQGLLARGHRPIVYSPRLGDFARTIRESGITVVDDLEAVTEVPDIIHGHHFIPTAEAIIRFPGTAALYVCHSWRFWVEQPPVFPQIRLHAGVNETIVSQLVSQNGLPAERVALIPNAVDLRRFGPRQRPWPDMAPRLLAFHGGGLHQPFIREAASNLGLPLTSLGRGGDRMTDTPEVELLAHDIVFATGRSALEAMACGCAVILCGEAGMAGLVTPRNFDWFRRCNFAGPAFTRPVSTDDLIKEIQACDPAEVAQVSARVREVASLDAQLDRFEEIYGDILQESADSPVSATAHQGALRKFLKAALPRLPYDKRWFWQEEQEWMAGEIEKWKAHYVASVAEMSETKALLELRRAETSETKALLELRLAELNENHGRVADLERQLTAAEEIRPLLELRAAELDQSRGRIADLERQLAAVGKTESLLSSAQLKNIELSDELLALRNSRSWRLTRPLRQLRKILSPT